MAVAVASPSTMEARPSPAGSPGQQPPSHAPYPYPVHQQSSSSSTAGSPAASPPPQGWAPGPPAFYPWQGGYPAMAPQGFYDPNAAQFAQWYHHMMLQQQQGQRPPGPPGQPPPHFPAFNHHAHNPFPSGTPPPAPQPAYARQPQQQPQQQPAPPGQPQQNYDGFHPYRRPQRQNTAEQHAQFSGLAPAQPPYARGADAAGSSSSVNSTNSNSTGRPRERERTSSLKAQAPHHPQQQQRPSPPPNVQQQRSRSQPAPSSLSRAAAAPVPPVANNNLNVNGPLAPPVRPQPHSRTGSNSSTASARPAPSPTTSTSTPSAPAPAPSTQAKPKAASTISAGSIGSIGVSPAPAGTPIARTPRPSPLGTAPPMSNADKRKSRDDSELLASGPPTNFGDGAHRPGGLKGKLRRALSLSAAQSIEPVVGGEDEEGPEGSAAGKKKRRALFNAKLNASTDNISLSSTMSSASVVIRKLGSLGKMARRNSIAGITSVFKGKKGKEDDEDGVIVDEPPPEDLVPAEKDKDKKKKEKDKKKGKASAKGSVAAPSVSAATVEVDRSSVEFTGLSPAAELARRHTLKANAQEAARIEADRRAAEAANANAGGKDLPETWAKNTATRAGVAGAGVYRVNEAGERVLVEDAEVDDDDPSAHDFSHYLEEDEGEWSRMDDAYEGEDGDGDETVRLRLRPGAGDEGSEDEDEDVEEWAVGLRRSVERTLVPQRGILKNARNYNQHVFLERTDQAAQPALRARANSAEQAGGKHPPGALAHMPSSDPDHIDGLHRQQHAPSLPPLSFTDSPGASDAEDTTPTSHTKLAQAQSVFSRPALNSSAPVLSLDAPSPPTLTHRAATAPSKRLTFASNLSVYDTFPGQVYDRRSEPATWSRLTPALAQRIKEELNSFKMEEMEVHAASRIHTQFFV